MKKISIIIPCYNLGDYVVKMLRSLKFADPNKVEIIILNDCSTDNTLQLIKDFSDFGDDWILINNNKNIGLSESRNKGISLANGEYIYFLDGDDVLTREFEDLVNTDLLHPFYKLRKRKNGTEKIKKNYLDSTQVSSMLFKKELFKDKKLFFPKNIIFEDNHFLMLLTSLLNEMEIKRCWTLSIIPFKYTSYREGSITASKHIFKTVFESFEKMKNLPADKKIKSFFLYQLWNSFMFNSKTKVSGFISNEDKKEVRSYLKEEFKNMSIYFFDLPILWKIRFISYKIFKIIF